MFISWIPKLKDSSVYTLYRARYDQNTSASWNQALLQALVHNNVSPIGISEFFSWWYSEHWVLESRIQLLESRIHSLKIHFKSHTAFTRIHATTLILKRRLQTTQTMQTALCSLENFNCYSLRDTDKFIHDLSPNRLQHWHGHKFPAQWLPISLLLRVKTFLVKFDFSLLKFFCLSCEDPGNHLLRSHSTVLSSKSESRSRQITSCRVGLLCMSSKNLTPRFCFAR